ncbi:Mut7-C RNAse domain-containing protein [Halococcus hamelinensis]|uniref:Mut7-C RNAse domain-containing protein n=1 Tax=Halococcus hamelinensis 100A6 TaxID=1132509 RepID=M0M4D5_9EURY|nr:Mut7-C RNAse domain-containing protein [Halococcus hamelinensis]EMA39240.1 hypothetical protein C447_06978 [Halococcus hamelinensis 100A6]
MVSISPIPSTAASRTTTASAPSLDVVAETDPTPAYAPDPTDQRVWRCVDCGQRFWKGSHWREMRDTLAAVSGERG